MASKKYGALLRECRDRKEELQTFADELETMGDKVRDMNTRLRQLEKDVQAAIRKSEEEEAEGDD